MLLARLLRNRAYRLVLVLWIKGITSFANSNDEQDQDFFNFLIFQFCCLKLRGRRANVKFLFCTTLAQRKKNYLPITRFWMASRAGAPVGLNPWSTAFSNRTWRLAFVGVLPFDLTPWGEVTFTFPDLSLVCV